jgi:D-alanyl-D-alanine carboxypeptidase
MRIGLLIILAAASGASASAAAPDQFAGLRQCVNEAAEGGRFSGVVQVARRGKVLADIAAGHADAAGRLPIGPGTRFNIASAGKMFTAIAIGQLVESGKLRFDQPIGEVLTGLPPEVAKVTVDQLLTHRSGLGDYLRMENRERIHAAKTATDLLPLAVAGGLAFQPGSKQQYSNSGFVVLGAIVEKLSGQSYADYVRAHIFVPAGMTTADLTGEAPRATALTRRNPDGSLSETPHPAPVMGGNRASPAGGATATAADLIRFGEALRLGKLLSRRLLDQLWMGRVPGRPADGSRLSYGYGFARMDFDKGRWLVGHNGGSLGVNAEFELFPDEGYTLVALSNYDPPSGTDAIRMSRRAVLGEAPCALQ